MTSVTYDNASDFEIQKLLIDMKNILLGAWSLSVFIFLSVITLHQNSVHHRLITFGLLSLSILVLLLSITSYSYEFYNTLPSNMISTRHHIDAIFYIIMAILFILVEISYGIYYHTKK